ncbi:hypothetical protein FRC08_001477 [Ceratobasidium sp. 394]|nr:hypothetical protein FRC08_001477 [Ceratobasidium sp. 394]
MFGKPLSVFFVATAAALSASALDIDTPKSLTQCNTVTLAWHGKKAPFVLAVLPNCESDIEEPLLELPPMNATTYEWTVNVPSKLKSIAFAITDAEGNEAYTDEVEIGKSNNVACLSSASSSAPPTNTGAAATSVAVRTTLTVSSASSIPSTPVNVAGSNGGNNSGNGGGNTGVANNKVSGAIANTASAFASMIGVATGLLALL